MEEEEGGGGMEEGWRGEGCLVFFLSTLLFLFLLLCCLPLLHLNGLLYLYFTLFLILSLFYLLFPLLFLLFFICLLSPLPLLLLLLLLLLFIHHLFHRILKTLLTDVIHRAISRSHPKLLLRRTESVAERMLTNWLGFCLHGYITVCVVTSTQINAFSTLLSFFVSLLLFSFFITAHLLSSSSSYSSFL